MHPYITNHIMSNMQDRLLQLMQLIQYPHVSLFSTIITNHFIGEEFCLGQTSIDGYKAMGFDVTQLTFIYNKDKHANTYVSVWGLFPVGKIWSSHSTVSLDLTNHNKGSLYKTFWNSLIEFLRTDLDGNLSSTLNPLTASRLNHTNVKIV
jgi:hypothetical protein